MDYICRIVIRDITLYRYYRFTWKWTAKPFKNTRLKNSRIHQHHENKDLIQSLLSILKSVVRCLIKIYRVARQIFPLWTFPRTQFNVTEFQLLLSLLKRRVKPNFNSNRITNFPLSVVLSCCDVSHGVIIADVPEA